MRNYLLSLFLTSFLFLPGYLNAQNNSNPKIDSSIVIQYFNSPDSLLINQTGTKTDSTLHGFECYNPLNKSFATQAQQGNVGRASHNLLFAPTLSIGFNLGIHTFDSYRFNFNSVPYLKALYSFSEIYYVQGGKKEQLFEVTHTQNILKHFTVGANFRLINSLGSYLRQKSDITNLFIFAGYQSKNKLYTNSMTYINNILKIQENGGIKYDTVFEQDVETNRKVIAVNLNNAENRIRDNRVQFFQEINLFRVSAADTISRSLISKLLPLKIKHYATYNTESYVYEDFEPGNTFYPVYPIDTNSMHDSIHFMYLRNDISLSNQVDVKFPLAYRIGFNHQYSELFNGVTTNTYNEWGSYFSCTLHLPWQFEFSGQYQVTSRENNRSERLFNNVFSKVFRINSNLNAKFSAYSKFSEALPSKFDTYYSSALFNWENDFLPIKTQRYGIQFNLRSFELGFETISRHNHIYYLPGSARPWQLSETVTSGHAWCRLLLRAGHFFLDNKVDYQKINVDKVIHLPEVISQHSLYAEVDLFAHALHLQPGFDLFYLSSYYAPRYMPATRVYYEQNDKKLNDQIYADFFLRFRISRARLFVKYQHFNALFGSKDYYLVPSYPMQDAGIKFGISWVFRDPPKQK